MSLFPPEPEQPSPPAASEPASAGTSDSTFEQSLGELEAIVHDLEEGQIGLGEALSRYEQGVGHLKRCYQLLDQAERKIELLTGVAADGTPVTEPFAAESESPAESAGRKRRPKTSRSSELPPLPPAETT